MSGWTDGYVTNTEYTSHFYTFLAPAAQNFALLLSGHMPVDLSQGFTYCELGCGQGYTTALLAAANPNGKFWGVDFNPAHIASAARMQAAAGLTNVTFLENSFAELVEADLPVFDFIALHGVWSWVSKANRDAITAFIAARLKPGGVVYISYNALPGWAAAAPLRQLLFESQRHKSNIDAAAVDDAVALANRMKEIGAGYFAAVPSSADDLDHVSRAPRNYLAHEYFNRSWTPFYFSDVAGDLQQAGLEFAGSSDIVEHIDQLCIGREAMALLAEVPDATARETIRDYFRNRRFRRDLFTRGARRLTAEESRKRMDGVRLALTAEPPVFPLQVEFPAGSRKLPIAPFGSIMALLAEKSRSLSELMANPELAAAGREVVSQSLLVLQAAGRVQPALPEAEESERRKSTARFNAAMLKQPAAREAQALASPVLGNGIPVPVIEQYVLALERGGNQVNADNLLRLMKKNNITFQTGSGAASPAGTAKAVGELLSDYRGNRRPLFRRLGIV